jgi:hypothetical protein
MSAVFPVIRIALDTHSAANASNNNFFSIVFDFQRLSLDQQLRPRVSRRDS